MNDVSKQSWEERRADDIFTVMDEYCETMTALQQISFYAYVLGYCRCALNIIHARNKAAQRLKTARDKKIK
jgi:hypothetical protein